MGLQERKRQKKIKEYVIERDGMLCCYCDQVLQSDTITMEHIVADSKKGTFNTTNLTVACVLCNNRRGNQPFFEYCKQFNWSEDKLNKYKKLYFNNLKIKVLNVAKEQCIKEELIIPNQIIKKACQILKIKEMDFSEYEKIYFFPINFNEECHRKQVKRTFEELIKIMEAEAA